MKKRNYKRALKELVEQIDRQLHDEEGLPAGTLVMDAGMLSALQEARTTLGPGRTDR